MAHEFSRNTAQKITGQVIRPQLFTQLCMTHKDKISTNQHLMSIRVDSINSSVFLLRWGDWLLQRELMPYIYFISYHRRHKALHIIVQDPIHNSKSQLCVSLIQCLWDSSSAIWLSFDIFMLQVFPFSRTYGQACCLGLCHLIILTTCDMHIITVVFQMSNGSAEGALGVGRMLKVYCGGNWSSPQKTHQSLPRPAKDHQNSLSIQPYLPAWTASAL